MSSPPTTSGESQGLLRDFADEDGKTLRWWIEFMDRGHPRIGINFEVGVAMFEHGEPRPYEKYSGRMNQGAKLLQLGWDMAARSECLIAKENA